MNPNREPTSSDASDQIVSLTKKAEEIAETGRYASALDHIHECDLWTPFLNSEDAAWKVLENSEDLVIKDRDEPLAKRFGQSLFVWDFVYSDDQVTVRFYTETGEFTSIVLTPNQADELRASLQEMDWEPKDELLKVEAAKR